MRLVQPVLFVCGDDEYDTLNAIKDSHREDVDILVPFEYQRHHLKLISGYIATEYIDKFPHRFILEDVIIEINKNPYGDYLRFFLIRFLKDNGGNWDLGKFILWKNKQNFVHLQNKKIKVLRYYELKRYYQTIVMDLNIGNGNIWNRIWGLVPNYFNDSSVAMILSKLSDDGFLVFNNIEGHMDKIFDYTREGFKKIEENYFQKLPTPKMQFKIPRKWL